MNPEQDAYQSSNQDALRELSVQKYLRISFFTSIYPKSTTKRKR